MFLRLFTAIVIHPANADITALLEPLQISTPKRLAQGAHLARHAAMLHVAQQCLFKGALGHGCIYVILAISGETRTSDHLPSRSLKLLPMLGAPSLSLPGVCPLPVDCGLRPASSAVLRGTGGIPAPALTAPGCFGSRWLTG